MTVKIIPSFQNHERFLAKISIDQTTGCWNWTARKAKNGYGQFTLPNKIRTQRVYLAHRVSWSIFKGIPSEGKVIDHKCRNRSCQNPDHMREVSRRRNILENSVGPAALNTQKVFCPKGHEYTKENTRIYRNGRHCRKCNVLRKKIVKTETYVCL